MGPRERTWTVLRTLVPVSCLRGDERRGGYNSHRRADLLRRRHGDETNCGPGTPNRLSALSRLGISITCSVSNEVTPISHAQQAGRSVSALPRALIGSRKRSPCQLASILRQEDVRSVLVRGRGRRKMSCRYRNPRSRLSGRVATNQDTSRRCKVEQPGSPSTRAERAQAT